jgi:hypothetical protein
MYFFVAVQKSLECIIAKSEREEAEVLISYLLMKLRVHKQNFQKELETFSCVFLVRKAHCSLGHPMAKVGDIDVTVIPSHTVLLTIN